MVVKGVADEMLELPKVIITKSWMGNQEQGSSTLVVMTFPVGGNKVFASYVGDSGYCILRPASKDRDYSVFFESNAQQRGFNFPYQLGWGKNGDQPAVAVELTHQVMNEDIIVMGTDGLFDNLSPAIVV